MMNLLKGTRWVSWPRLAGVAVTVGLFIVVFQRIDRAVFWQTLGHIHFPWLILALLTYGLALGLGALRWHLALSLTERAVHVGASGRLLFIGHFFFILLFGAAGGDVAKSILYARWFGYEFPEVFAAVPLDRGLGSVGAVFLALTAVGLGFLAQGFARPFPWPWQFQSDVFVGVAGLAVVLLLGFLYFYRLEEENAWNRSLRALGRGTARLFRMPQLGIKGLTVSLAGQLATNGVFAFNLLAVSHGPLPWMQLAWAIPTITMVSCFPITFAGAGVREVASVALLGLYGVPAGDCVAAAMLTLLIKLLWSGVGGMVFWREQSRLAKSLHRKMPSTVSVVIPAVNEEEALPETVRRLQAVPEVSEIILVDGGSRDSTREIASRLGCRVLDSKPGRGGQLRLGAAHATGDVVLLLHADTWMPPQAGKALSNCLRDPTVVAGGFWKVFRKSPRLLLGSRYKCAVRLWLWRRIAGDQALFVRREVLEQIGGVPDVPLMEEFELCKRLNRVGRLALAGAKIETSARRFEKHGVLRTYLLMGWVHTLYRLGKSPEELQRIYERN
jgi:rSAM/selenodomain-associated transferase 2